MTVLEIILDVHENAECFSEKDVLLELLEARDINKELENEVREKLLQEHDTCWCGGKLEYIVTEGEKEEYYGFEITDSVTIGKCNNCGKIYE